MVIIANGMDKQINREKRVMTKSNQIQSDKAQEETIRKGRWSRQREILLSELHEHSGHLDAYNLYLRAKEKESRISLSTVYRALAHFTDTGLVKQLTFDGAGRFYEIAKPMEHHHLLCLGCGEIIELNPVLGQDEEKLLAQMDIDLVAVEVTLKGYCSACRHQKRGGGAMH